MKEFSGSTSIDVRELSGTVTTDFEAAVGPLPGSITADTTAYTADTTLITADNG